MRYIHSFLVLSINFLLIADIFLEPTSSVVDFELPVHKHAVQCPYILAISFTT